MLDIRELQTGYQKKQVLFSLSLEVRQGEIVALIGPNGAGKSTVLKAVLGLIPVWGGEILFNGTSINGSTPAQNVARGITFAPQGNRVFDELTVIENLEIAGFQFPRKELKGRIDEVFEIFPILKDRSNQEASKLSGGEQQMIALARALIPKPKLLMLDEPTLGLSPNLVCTVLEEISKISHSKGVAVLIVEQKVRDVLEICHRLYSIKLGKVIFTGLPSEIKHDKQKLKELFL